MPFVKCDNCDSTTMEIHTCDDHMKHAQGYQVATPREQK